MVQRAKLSDVARLAGVSQATASRVLNGLGTVDPTLAERVHDAKRKLGYRSNSLARGLRRRANNVVGVVVPDVTNPFFTDVVRGVEDAISPSGHLLVLCNSDESAVKERQYLGLLVDQQVAGVVIAPVHESEEGIAAVLDGTPAVAVDRRLQLPGVDSVTLDNVGGAKELVRFLLQRTPDVAIIAGPVTSTTGRERLQGYREAIEEAGLHSRLDWIVEGDYSESGGYEAAMRLLEAEAMPSAIFSANNLMAQGLLRALAERGIDREALALASFGPLGRAPGVGWGAVSSVASLDLPSYEIGARAAAMLLERIDGLDVEARSERLEHGSVLT
ncbi:LacI family DNA-binding transcriptional regulator [Agrococcus sp. Marseille-P2731]|uniref:LacI family DNA-binding transcriptional regulator n=1 Tax=Agrococcus sp. Marseille-P2731 TaxID=1841862 RepID=UPI000931BB79|nr:LacI family DNA-binding transcriptional regulator [Agrococcus sp. Marseille-P2731]